MASASAEKALNHQSPAEVGAALLVLAEDQWFERKSARISPRDLADTLIGFANADGGLVVVGLHDGRVEGTKASAPRLNAQMQANIDFCTPPVRAKTHLVECVDDEGDGDQLLVIQVSSGESVHSNTKEEVFLRVGDENRKLSFAQRQELLYDKGQATYESRALPKAEFDRLDDQLLTDYAETVGAPDPFRLLRARGLSTKFELTIAGCLLFARVPQEFFPEAFIRVLRWRGGERGSGVHQQLIEDHIVEGPIPDQLLEARNHVLRLQPTRRALMADGKFGSVALVPEDAWLEGIVNAAVHRSYSVAGDHIRVEIFDDRIEISSPGRFPGLVDPHDPLQTTRFARNPRIARVCADLHFGQELGEGIRRMFEEMRAAGLSDPIYRQTSGSVELTLLAEPVDRQLEARLPEHARQITMELRRAGRLSTGEVAEILRVSRPTAQRELGRLREAEIIEWIGNSSRDPRAYWRLKSS
ncbi:MAG TPA: ATP-binding protein [Solirubrobacterales bacterium]|nr:ATP-binding protein [Solirubrobacterales bacterium]